MVYTCPHIKEKRIKRNAEGDIVHHPAFSDKEDNQGGYPVYVFLGTVYTVGLQLIWSIGDWISLLFRTGKEEITSEKTEKITTVGENENFITDSGYILRINDSEGKIIPIENGLFYFYGL